MPTILLAFACRLFFLQLYADISHAWQYLALHVVAHDDVQRVALLQLQLADIKLILSVADAFAQNVALLVA